MILKQNIPYAALIYSALDVCEIMLSHTDTLYPFAVVSIDNDIHSIFADDFANDIKEHVEDGLIEKLAKKLSVQRQLSSNFISVLVYLATIETREGVEGDAIVFNITDANHKNTITLYPYTREHNTLALGTPFTCDFAD